MTSASSFLLTDAVLCEEVKIKWQANPNNINASRKIISILFLFRRSFRMFSSHESQTAVVIREGRSFNGQIKQKAHPLDDSTRF